MAPEKLGEPLGLSALPVGCQTPDRTDGTSFQSRFQHCVRASRILPNVCDSSRLLGCDKALSNWHLVTGKQDQFALIFILEFQKKKIFQKIKSWHSSESSGWLGRVFQASLSLFGLFLSVSKRPKDATILLFGGVFCGGIEWNVVQPVPLLIEKPAVHLKLPQDHHQSAE